MESARYSFGEFELNAVAFELQRCGERVRLERIPMELLLLLVSRHGELVSRDEIVAKLWGSDIFIDTNTAINVAVRKVRQVLDDNVESPLYILTVPAKGYRFIGMVSAGLSLPSGENSSAASDSGHATRVAAVQIEVLDWAPPVPMEKSPPDAGRDGARGPTNSAPPATGQGRGQFRWLIWIVAALILCGVTATVLRRRNHAPTDRLMFVVLPFENLSGDPAQEYIADGMTEEMIAQMGSLDPQRIGVIARTSAMHFKGTQLSAAEIARNLGVGYLLEGSVRHVGDRVRVTAQLIKASDQTHLWAAEYDSDFGNLLQLESNIARAIAAQVQVKLDADSRRRFPPVVRPEAQAAYLRGLEDWNLRTNSSITDAISEFQQAIAEDPNYALPYAALARCYVLGPIFGVGNPLQTMPRARDLSARALDLNPNLAEAHSILAMVAAHDDYDWPTAEREFLTALRLNPSDPNAHLFYSNSFLSPHGRHKEAIDEVQKAIALDPFSIPLQAFLVRTYTWARRDDEARSQFGKTNEVAPNFAVLHERAAHLFASEGNFIEAIDEDARARLLSGEQPEQVIASRRLQAQAVAEGGVQSYWKLQLQLSAERPGPPEAYVSPFGLAVIYARLGQKDQALSALRVAFDRRDVQLTEINVEPAFDSLRAEPGFRDLVRRIHLK
jgi:TolB-like protein/DNA-binding winged helix-turn-helix (wHTH) protein/Tfp pilus assembly protein PilF